MKGSIRKRGETYQYRISYKEGEKRKYIEKGGFKLKKDCEVAMNKAIEEINDTGVYIKIKKIILNDLFNEFIQYEAPLSKKETTILKYQAVYKSIVEETFGDKYVHSIKASDIQKLYLDKLESFSLSYVKSAHSLINMLYDYALRMEYIKDNTMDKVSQPYKSIKGKSNITIFTDEQLTWLSNRLINTDLRMPFMLGIHLGARTGEVYGLRWSDIDFENDTVNINKQLQCIKGIWYLDVLKTNNSYRTIKFGKVLKDYLLQEKDKYDRCKKAGAFTYTNKVIMRCEGKTNLSIIDDFVSVNKIGKVLNAYSNPRFTRLCKNEKGFDFKYHNLRHTHATMLLEAGINPKYIQERLGHATFEFTLKLYAHTTLKMDIVAANTSDKLFNF